MTGLTSLRVLVAKNVQVFLVNYISRLFLDR